MPLHALNPETTNTKIDFIKSHLDQTHIIADFDGTLTKYFDEVGKARPSIISLLRDENILDEDYAKEAKAMYAKYSVIEHDNSIPLVDRQAVMVEWRTTHKELLIKKGLTYQNIEYVMSQEKIIIRPGVKELLLHTHLKSIPVIIFSASGIGTDSIQILLNHWNLNLPNISIVSNKLYRDDNGKMIGYSKPVIHGLNKTEDVLLSQEYKHIQDTIVNKPHTILLGDGIGDATMAVEKPGKTVLKIGLCNDKVEERLQTYEKLFDIIITHDDGLEEVIKKVFQDTDNELLKNTLMSEGFPVVYEWHDEPGTQYEKHCHQDKVSIYVTQGMVTFTFDDKTTKTISQGQRFDVPPKVSHTAVVGPTGCDYIVGQMTEDDA